MARKKKPKYEPEKIYTLTIVTNKRTDTPVKGKEIAWIVEAAKKDENFKHYWVT